MLVKGAKGVPISDNDIDYVKYVGPRLPRERISIAYAIPVWMNDRNSKHMLMFLLKNLVRKGLILPI